jgi:hypothetical protein
LKYKLVNNLDESKARYEPSIGIDGTSWTCVLEGNKVSAVSMEAPLYCLDKTAAAGAGKASDTYDGENGGCSWPGSAVLRS